MVNSYVASDVCRADEAPVAIRRYCRRSQEAGGHRGRDMASRRSHFTFVLLELIDLGTAPQDVAVLFSPNDRRQRDNEGRARIATLAFDPDSASVHLDDLSDDREPKAQPALGSG